MGIQIELINDKNVGVSSHLRLEGNSHCLNENISAVIRHISSLGAVVCIDLDIFRGEVGS